MERKWAWIAVGLAAWTLGLAVIRLFGDALFDGGIRQALFTAAQFAVPPLVMPPLARWLDRTQHELVVPSVLIAMPAMLMDAVAVGWTDWYASSADHRVATGSVLLFAFWSLLFWALVWHRPATGVAAR